MSLLPSPIPHPLDYSPWELPGWVYEALDWVVGVEWPEGDERAVWDLADQWYGVAAALAGPHADAVAAAGEVRSGYGGVGAVAVAFDQAWRRVAEGDQAPLPVLLAVSNDLGRVVEECGCDIEGAKLEVWIELGILVVELLSLAVATVLTAGAASPAATAAITATRVIVQHIFKRLMAQLARKALKQGLKEAGERAAKQVTKGGVRGLARRAAVGGASEAAEEGGISLATQAYQNSTGRRHSLDLADLGTSALGGLAGGAAAPLAGLGRHATGRGARIGEHVGREMTGEVIAEQAASLATGQGPTSLEDAARAAVSGASGSATAHADAALQTRLHGQMSALAGASFAPNDLGLPPAHQLPSSQPLAPGADAVDRGPDLARHAPGEDGVPRQWTTSGDEPSSSVGAPPDSSLSTSRSESDPASTRVGEAVPSPSLFPPAATVAVPPDPQSAAPGASPTLSSVPPTGTVTTPLTSSGVLPPGIDLAQHNTGAVGTGNPTTNTSPPFTAAAMGSTSTVVPGPTSGAGPADTSAPAPPVAAAAAAPSQVPHPGIPNTSPSQSSAGGGSSHQVSPPLPRPPSADEFPSVPTAGGPPDAAASTPRPDRPEAHTPRTPEWYAAKWAADKEAFERRRYRGYYESQRRWFEEKRRFDEAARLRTRADEHHQRARDYAAYALQLHQIGQQYLANEWQRAADDETRAYGDCLDLADAVLAGDVVPQVVGIDDLADFRRINDDVGELTVGAVETADRSALTGDDDPPPIDRSRKYGQPGGLRPPLALHQTDVERQMPREADGSVVRTADPRVGGWFGLVNDGGPKADPTRGINCIDCTLSLFDTWMHGRPRVSAPRTFDAYLAGDVTRPIEGEQGGVGRIEDITGGRFQRLCQPSADIQGPERQRAIDAGYRKLHDQVRLGGHGSFAFVINSWEKGGAHIWVALNQNGTVLYLDPQNGIVQDTPLYRHRGRPHPENAVDTEVLVLDRDGRPMPLGGLRRGRFSERPDLPDYPPVEEDQGYGEPYLNRMHLLDPPGSSRRHDDGHDPQEIGQPLDFARHVSPAEWSALAALRDGAVAVADEVEDVLAAVARQVTDTLGLNQPVYLRDQEFRVKSLDSLVRKYIDEAHVFDVPVEDFGRNVNDVLRFSFSMPAGEQYGDAVPEIIAELTRAGFVVHRDGCKNFWREGNRFYGFNCTVVSPHGQTFELQLHSEASREAWLHTHSSYEVLRRGTEPPERRVHALLRMLATNREYGMVGEIPPGLRDRFPAKDATFAKWIWTYKLVWRDYLGWLDRHGRSFGQVVREFGLTAEDFPISRDLETQLERTDVHLLRNLPRRREN